MSQDDDGSLTPKVPDDAQKERSSWVSSFWERFQKNAAQKDDAQKDDTQKDAAQKNAAQKDDAQKDAAQKNAAQKNAAQKDDAQKPVDSQSELAAGPAGDPESGRVRMGGEDYLQKFQQKGDKAKEQRAENLRQRGIPLPGTSLRGQPGQVQKQGAANLLPTPPTAQTEPVTTTGNTLGKVEGQWHTINQAGEIQTVTNVFVTREDVMKGFMRGFTEGVFEKSFKVGVAIGEANEKDGRGPDTASGSPHKASASMDEKLVEGIQSGSTDAAFVNEAGTEATADARALPKNDKEIERWYYQELSERDRCFVKAAAVLHGAPLLEVAEASKELYEPLKERDEERKAQASEVAPPAPLVPSSSISELVTLVHALSQRDERTRTDQVQVGASQGGSTTLPAVDSGNSLLERTHTYTLRVNGAMRLLWQDADASGLSGFSVELLRFLAQESALEDIVGSQSGQHFLDIIGQWPAKYAGERSWRSASALGVIWWHQNAQKLLWGRANEWASSQREQDWEHAAALLDGAYQVERDTMKVGADNVVNSAVLQLLEQWVVIAQEAETERGEGYAAARAYALIGRKSPEIALKGLERLLCFLPQPKGINEGPRYPPENLFVFSVLKYIDIVRSGHVRQVLKHLAEGAERLAHWRGSSQMRGERRENRHQSTVALHVIFTAFFLVAACSLSAVDKDAPASYSPGKRLPDHPSCPDSKGRDILLVGLLAKAERHLWQDQLAMLLCALIMEKNVLPALYLLRRWGEIVLKDKSKDAVAIEAVYEQFLVKVGKLILDWSADRGSGRTFAIGAYKHELTLWETDMRLPQPGSKKLAQKVLSQLP